MNMNKSTGFKDKYGNELLDGDIIENVNYGTKMKIKYDDERNCFSGNYYPTKSKPHGFGVWDIKCLDFKNYFKIN